MLQGRLRSAQSQTPFLAVGEPFDREKFEDRGALNADYHDNEYNDAKAPWYRDARFFRCVADWKKSEAAKGSGKGVPAGDASHEGRA